MSPSQMDDWNPESAILPPPRFLGSLDGQGARDSLVTTSTAHHSDGVSSVYALNNNHESYSSRGSPRTASAPLVSPFADDPRSPTHDAYDPSVPLSTTPSPPRLLSEKEAVYAAPKSRRKRIFILAAIVAVILIAAAVAIPLATIKHHSNTSDAVSPSSQSSSATAAKPTSSSSPNKALVTGGDGSVITMEDGTKFTYTNKFGGVWYFDQNDPFNNGAYPQSWTPPLNQPFNWGVDHVRGVNLGGWLVLEPFITPNYYQRYGSVDEWTLSTSMAADAANGGIGQIENHYKTFITEQDFAEIAGAGLNFVRIPLAFWAIETRQGEPFLAKTSWTYFLKAIQWARKYGLRINLDFHAVPGSQNGWNHSGRLGTINFLNGPMGYANAQRSLDYIRILAEFISQPQYRNVVTIFGIMNEPMGTTIGQGVMADFYYQVYQVVRKASGIGAGNGPMISYHDAFEGIAQWVGYLPQADRIAMDTHPYLCFGPQNPKPIAQQVNDPCTMWGPEFNTSMGAFGFTAAGEWSVAVTDCGTFVNGAGLGARYDGTFDGAQALGSCDPWINYATWSQDLKTSTQQLALASMDALQNWFFWTWKIGPAQSGNIESPSWSYQLGLKNGWIPKDPRQSAGVCGNTNPWQGPLTAAQVGGNGAGQIPANVAAQYPWPPANIPNGGPVGQLPQYAPNGPLVVLPSPTFTATNGTKINAGTGWNNPQDNTLMSIQNPNCPYLTPWQEGAFAVPAQCPAA